MALSWSAAASCDDPGAGVEPDTVAAQGFTETPERSFRKARYPRYANAPAHRYAKWAMEVARFSFTPTTADVIRAATPPAEASRARRQRVGGRPFHGRKREEARFT